MSPSETTIRGLTGAVRAEIEQVACGITRLEDRVTALRQELNSMHRVPRADEVIDACASAWGVTSAAIRGKARPETIIAPRQAAMYLMRAAGMPFQAIGRALLRDHGTVIYGCRVVADRLATEPEFAEKVMRIAGDLGIEVEIDAKKTMDNAEEI